MNQQRDKTTETKRPNILFLFSDEHSFRFMGHVPPEEGGEPAFTPTFDGLADKGTVFTNTYCQMPLCTPSRLCLLTGREVRRCGAWTNEAVLRPELPTLPRVLADAGYETCLVGKMHLGGTLQFAGFQHRPYGDLTGKCGHQWEPIDSPDAHTMRMRTVGAGITGIPESLIQDEIVAHETVAFLREHQHAHPEQPWFLCASFSRPHFPLTAPRRYFERYWPNGVTEPKVGSTGDAYDHPMSVGMRRGFRADAIPDDEMMKARAAYFACVSYLDEVIGDQLLRLERDGLLENTIIVYTTDHGEMAGEHGVWWKNGWYEGCTRVPFIVSLPEQRSEEYPHHECRTPVGLVDLFPTLCAFAGVNPPEDLDGIDLSAAVLGEAAASERPIFCDALTPRWGAGTEFRMIRWNQYKYVRFRQAPPLLFDLENDPEEQHNLIDSASGPSKDALEKLQILAENSIDFDAAEHERIERDGELRRKYAQNLPPAMGNLYIMPSGKLVNADDVIYHPTVISEHAADAFADWPGELSIDDFTFDGPLGSQGTTIEKVRKNHFKATLGHAPNHEDWCNKLQFQITRNAKGNTLHLDVVFNGGNAYILNEYFHSWSYDGKNWHPIHWTKQSKDSKEGDTLIFPKFTEDCVYVGHQVPMSYEDLVEMVETWEKSSYVKAHVLGKSLGKRNIYRLEITDPESSYPENARWGHYFTNQHPGEHNSQWRMVGMINWLLSDEGSDCRKRSSCHFVIMMSPDASSHGWYRVNAQGVDMNRSYQAAGSDQKTQAHEAYICQKDLEALMSSKTPVADVWSMHTWGGIVEPICTPGPEMGSTVGSWTKLKEILERNDLKNLVKPLTVREESGDPTYWTGGPHTQFGVTAFLCEGAGGLYTKQENLDSGVVLIKSIAEYYANHKIY